MTPVRSRIPALLAIGFVALVVVVGLRWFLENYERRPIEYRADYSEAARRNPLLALARYLDEAGFEVTSADRLQELVDRFQTTDAAIVDTRGLHLAPSQLARLTAWLEQGGHLVVTPGQAWDETLGRSGDRFFDELDVRLVEVTSEAYPTAALSEVTRVTLAATATPAAVAFQPSRFLVDGGGRATAGVGEGGAEEDADRAYHLLDYAVGRGRVTVASDLRFLRNDAISDNDHAWFAQNLLGPDGSTRVLLVHGRGAASLIEILWRNASYALLSLALLGVAALWRRAAQFGPQVGIRTPARRDLREGLTAGQRFLWTQRARSAVLRGARDNLERLWSRRLPRAARAGSATLTAEIASSAGITVTEVRRALLDPVDDESALLAATRTLQQLDLHFDGPT